MKIVPRTKRFSMTICCANYVALKNDMFQYFVLLYLHCESPLKVVTSTLRQRIFPSTKRNYLR